MLRILMALLDCNGYKNNQQSIGIAGLQSPVLSILIVWFSAAQFGLVHFFFLHLHSVHGINVPLFIAVFPFSAAIIDVCSRSDWIEMQWVWKSDRENGRGDEKCCKPQRLYNKHLTGKISSSHRLASFISPFHAQVSGSGCIIENTTSSSNTNYVYHYIDTSAIFRATIPFIWNSIWKVRAGEQGTRWRKERWASAREWRVCVCKEKNDCVQNKYVKTHGIESLQPHVILSIKRCTDRFHQLKTRGVSIMIWLLLRQNTFFHLLSFSFVPVIFFNLVHVLFAKIHCWWVSRVQCSVNIASSNLLHQILGIHEVLIVFASSPPLL